MSRHQRKQTHKHQSETILEGLSPAHQQITWTAVGILNVLGWGRYLSITRYRSRINTRYERNLIRNDAVQILVRCESRID